MLKPYCYVSVPSGGSWWEQPRIIDAIASRKRGFSTLWWVVVGATRLYRVNVVRYRSGFSTLWWVVVGATLTSTGRAIVNLTFQYPLVGRGGSNSGREVGRRGAGRVFQYPLVGRGGSNITQIYCQDVGGEVSVPSGGSWWEQRGLGLYPPAPRWRFSTLWWVVVGATIRSVECDCSATKFQYPLVGRGGSNSPRLTSPLLQLGFQYPLVGRGGSNTKVRNNHLGINIVSVPSGGSWWEQHHIDGY